MSNYNRTIEKKKIYNPNSTETLNERRVFAIDCRLRYLSQIILTKLHYWTTIFFARIKKLFESKFFDESCNSAQ